MGNWQMLFIIEPSFLYGRVLGFPITFRITATLANCQLPIAY
jgi:hypothetical protein